jgi:FAD synthase
MRKISATQVRTSFSFLLTQVNQGVAELISLMLWRIWLVRNDVMHGEKLHDVVSVNFPLNSVESLQYVLMWGS